MSSAEADPRVVLVLGCGRSGTTLVYELLAAHPEAAWISTWTDRTGLPGLARFNRLFTRGNRPGRFYPPRPSEGYRTWDRAYPPSAAREGMLEQADQTARERGAIRRFADRHCAATRSSLFVNKNTRNSRRIAMLREVFPEAGFLHVRRDPLDTVSSLLRVAWWPDLPLWFARGRTPRQLCATPADEAALAAELYVRELDAIERGRALVPDRHWTDVSYERLVEDPDGSLGPLLAAAGVEPVAAVRARLRDVRRDSVGIHAHTLTSDQRHAAEAVLDP